MRMILQDVVPSFAISAQRTKCYVRPPSKIKADPSLDQILARQICSPSTWTGPAVVEKMLMIDTGCGLHIQDGAHLRHLMHRESSRGTQSVPLDRVRRGAGEHIAGSSHLRPPLGQGPPSSAGRCPPSRRAAASPTSQPVCKRRACRYRLGCVMRHAATGLYTGHE
eukprot:2807615-Pleurochrysis_carterae.AAC.2